MNQKEFREMVLRADNNVCQDPLCECHRGYGLYWLTAHHIISKSLDGTRRDDFNNGITLCQIAHERAERGYGHRSDRVSACEYMIKVLESHENRPDFRWKEVLELLKLRRERHATEK